MLTTVSNLYPRPDQPNRGIFNAQQFLALARVGCRASAGTSAGERVSGVGCRVSNICLVPEWRVWRWPRIRRWSDPFTDQLNTRYIPAFYVPLVGRNQSWRTYARGLRAYKGHSSCSGICENAARDEAQTSGFGVFTNAATDHRPLSAILATWLYPDCVAAARLAEELGVPVWFKVHGSDRFHLEAPGRRNRILAACEQAKGIICVCRSLADALAAAGVPEEKLHVVPNGVDTDLFRYRSKQDAAAVLQQRLPAGLIRDSAVRSGTVLFVGNLLPVKGPDILLRAWRCLVSDGPPSTVHRLLLIGSGPMQARLQQQATHLGITDSVIFLGGRPHDEIPLWMNVADCLCLSSRSEGMPNVVLESLASGLPVVATDVGACRELLAGESRCHVVAREDPEAMATAIQQVLELDPDRKALASEHGDRLSWDASARRLLEVITE